MVKIDASIFKRLIGVWKTEGNIRKGKDILKLDGIDSYEFILDGNFILHKADVMMGNERSETLEIIGLDQSTVSAKMQYYNAKGDTGVMTCSLVDSDFNITGDQLKFEGTIGDKNENIIGKWYVQSENGEWAEFIDISLTKQI